MSIVGDAVGLLHVGRGSILGIAHVGSRIAIISDMFRQQTYETLSTQEKTAHAPMKGGRAGRSGALDTAGRGAERMVGGIDIIRLNRRIGAGDLLAQVGGHRTTEAVIDTRMFREKITHRCDDLEDDSAIVRPELPAATLNAGDAGESRIDRLMLAQEQNGSRQDIELVNGEGNAFRTQVRGDDGKILCELLEGVGTVRVHVLGSKMPCFIGQTSRKGQEIHVLAPPSLVHAQDDAPHLLLQIEGHGHGAQIDDIQLGRDLGAVGIEPGYVLLAIAQAAETRHRTGPRGRRIGTAENVVNISGTQELEAGHRLFRIVVAFELVGNGADISCPHALLGLGHARESEGAYDDLRQLLRRQRVEQIDLRHIGIPGVKIVGAPGIAQAFEHDIGDRHPELFGKLAIAHQHIAAVNVSIFFSGDQDKIVAEWLMRQKRGRNRLPSNGGIYRSHDTATIHGGATATSARSEIARSLAVSRT